MEEDLLKKVYWDNQDIANYLKCGMTKASRIHQLAVKEYNGRVICFPRKVYRDAVLRAVGIDPEEAKRGYANVY